MMREIDQALSRFWESGLNVFYIDPPVVSHDEQDDSQIERDRKLARKKQMSADGVMYVTLEARGKRLRAGGSAAHRVPPPPARGNRRHAMAAGPVCIGV